MITQNELDGHFKNLYNESILQAKKEIVINYRLKWKFSKGWYFHLEDTNINIDYKQFYGNVK